MSLLSAVLQEGNKNTCEDLTGMYDAFLPKIKDLVERVLLFSWTLQQHFIDTYVTYSVSKSLEQLNYKNRKEYIVIEFNTCIKEMKILQEPFDLVENQEFVEYWQSLTHSYNTLMDLYCVAVEGKGVLDRANQEFRRFNYSQAIRAVQGLKKDIRNIEIDNNYGPDVLQAMANLNSQAENQLALYLAHLSTEWENIFTWSEKNGLHYLTYSLSVQQSDPILLKKVLNSLYETERMNAELGLFSHFFIDQLLHNIIRYQCNIYTDDPIGAIIFNIKIDLNDTQKPSYQTIFNNLTAVFEFLQSTLSSHFDKDRTFVEVFSDTIQDKFFNKIIEDCIRNNLPSCDSSYQQYKNIVLELDAFNKFLIELKFVQANQSPLNKYIDDTECVLYNKKCDKLLSDIRTLLSESLSSGTVVVGSSNDDSVQLNDNETWDLTKPLFLPKCVISHNVKQIMTMIVEHLVESSKLPEKYRNQLVTYVKDFAVMYQRVVPKKFKVNLDCCPADIALFFNNCYYLAHGLVGPPWSTTLPASLAARLAETSLETIQDLRVLGLEKLSLYLQTQKSVIVKSMEVEDLSTPWSPSTFEQFDCSVNDALTLMKELKSAWSVLPRSMYHMCICTLVQVLYQAMLDRVFGNTKAMSEKLVFVLAVRIDDVVQEVEELFEEPIPFEEKIDVWRKFTTLPLLLKAQLLEVAEVWKKKDQLQCFSCEEVRQIVKIRFPDDKFRLKILKEIQ